MSEIPGRGAPGGELRRALGRHRLAAASLAVVAGVAVACAAAPLLAGHAYDAIDLSLIHI